MNSKPGRKLIPVETRILSENDRIAAANRAWFEAHGILVVNLISSPGSGKTTLLVETLKSLKGKLTCAVIEGDQQTDLDARRIAETGVPVKQVNTGQACHLDAAMVKKAVTELPLENVDILFIENVGNLICPAEFDLGEQIKVVLMSVTEGEEKPLKYPLIFHLAGITLITKTDLIPHLHFDLQLAQNNIHQVNARAPIILTSAYTQSGIKDWVSWLEHERQQAGKPAVEDIPNKS